MSYPKAEELVTAISAHFLSFRKLSARRILGIGFLCDWKHCIEFGAPMTECNWLVSDNWVKSEEFSYKLFTSRYVKFPNQSPSATPCSVTPVGYPYSIGSTADLVCKHVFSVLQTRTDFDLDQTILSTYPFDRTGPIDMVSLSKEYVSKYGREYLFEMRA
ncbi:MAG: hypothetical protein AAFY24_19135 [Pseudomonadota bacterium]